MGTLIRVVLVLVSLAVGGAITASADNPIFLILGAVLAFVFWRVGRKRRHRGGRSESSAAYDWDDHDGGGGGGNGGGGNGGGGGGD